MGISLDIQEYVLHHCLERMLVFCSLDAYEKYDMRGAQLNAEHGDIIHRDHVTCINVMNARSPVAAWETLMPGTELMAKLPTDTNLLDMDEAQWGEVKQDISCVLNEMTSVKGIGLAAATKMLALKRPELIPACDSQLVDYFDIGGSTDADKALKLMVRLRVIAQSGGNLDSLNALKACLTTYTLFDQPVCLTTTRIIEVLCWMETDAGYRQLWRALGWE